MDGLNLHDFLQNHKLFYQLGAEESPSKMPQTGFYFLRK